MREKKIPHYVNDPIVNRLTAPENKLYRPPIQFDKLIIKIILVLMGTALLSLAIEKALVNSGAVNIKKSGHVQMFFFIYWKVQLIVLVISLRYVLICIIKIYQHYAKSETRLRCCYIPRCSEYAILVVKKYGAILGGIKAVQRLLRCKPPGGIDYPYVIEIERCNSADVIKKLCESIESPPEDSAIPLTTLWGYMSKSRNLFQVTLLWADRKQLHLRIIKTNSLFQVIRTDEHAFFLHEIDAIYANKSGWVISIAKGKIEIPILRDEIMKHDQQKKAIQEMIMLNTPKNSSILTKEDLQKV